MEWSKEKSILGRGPCKNKGMEGLQVFLFGCCLFSFLLEYSCFTVLCEFLLYRIVNVFKQRCYWHFGQDCYRTLPTP